MQIQLWLSEKLYTLTLAFGKTIHSFQGQNVGPGLPHQPENPIQTIVVVLTLTILVKHVIVQLSGLNAKPKWWSFHTFLEKLKIWYTRSMNHLFMDIF